MQFEISVLFSQYYRWYSDLIVQRERHQPTNFHGLCLANISLSPDCEPHAPCGAATFFKAAAPAFNDFQTQLPIVEEAPLFIKLSRYSISDAA
jgi:hypothetical protein